jgi:putative NADH-flavin reductase
MASKLQGRKIAFIGASGQLGKPTIEALINLGVHTITAIQRPEATSTFPARVIIKKGNLNNKLFLNRVLKG